MWIFFNLYLFYTGLLLEAIWWFKNIKRKNLQEFAKERFLYALFSQGILTFWYWLITESSAFKQYWNEKIYFRRRCYLFDGIGLLDDSEKPSIKVSTRVLYQGSYKLLGQNHYYQGLLYKWFNISKILTLLFPMHPFSTPWKHLVLERGCIRNKWVKNSYSVRNSWKFMERKEAATGGVLYKKVFLKISQNSQEKTCARASSFNIKRENFGTGAFLWILVNF